MKFYVIIFIGILLNLDAIIENPDIEAQQICSELVNK